MMFSAIPTMVLANQSLCGMLLQGAGRGVLMQSIGWYIPSQMSGFASSLAATTTNNIQTYPSFRCASPAILPQRAGVLR